MSTNIRPKSSVHRTGEEKAKLLELIQAESRDNGWIVPGFDIRASKVLIGRSVSAIESFRHNLVKSKKFPSAKERAKYLPLDISDSDASYLAAMLDGEGTLRFDTYTVKSTKTKTKESYRIHLVIAYNTDKGILKKIEKIVPFVKIRACMNSGLGEKQLYGATVYGFRNTYTVLQRILPFLAHTGKLKRAKEIIEHLEFCEKLEGARFKLVV